MRTSVRRVVGSHRVLALAYLTGGVAAALLATLGRLGDVVGNYVVPFEGDLVPDGLWRAAVEHLDQVALGVGVLPVVLGTAWLVTTAVHADRRDAHAFAALLLALVPLLVLQVTSFDLRFTPEQFIQDRYLFYLVPLFAVGCASWLVLQSHVRTKLVSAVGAGAAVVALLLLAPDEDTVIFWASPAAAFRPALTEAASRLGLGDTTFLQLATAVAVLAVVLLAWRAPRIAVAGHRLGARPLRSGAGRLRVRPLRRARAGRLDARPARLDRRGGSERLLRRPRPGRCRRARPVVGGRAVEPERRPRAPGRRRRRRSRRSPRSTRRSTARRDASSASQPSDYLVVASGETRFGLAASRTVALNRPLELLRVERPYRLAWASEGLTRDGWMLPGRPVTVRVFGRSAPERRAVQITLASSRLAAGRIGFAIAAGGETIRGTVDPGGARPPVDVTVCVPARSHVDVRLRSRGRVQLEHGRTVALHVERIALSRSWPCAAS